MNERIQELAKQSGISLIYEYDGYDGHAGVCNLKDIEKFAELIVRECALQAETKLLKGLKSHETHQLSYNEGMRDGIAEFKKHFGVET